ncbi:unnamed protein product [Rodentolepis nana]|uniref:Uncharacterized protein n=1 Tax=Rodentolepis nana TaxID=102285 RepID=A0A0R3TMW7_RODNA|nr:unnamed protein product [Rodentolepis nana]
MFGLEGITEIDINRPRSLGSTANSAITTATVLRSATLPYPSQMSSNNANISTTTSSSSNSKSLAFGAALMANSMVSAGADEAELDEDDVFVDMPTPLPLVSHDETMKANE